MQLVRTVNGEVLVCVWEGKRRLCKRADPQEPFEFSTTILNWVNRYEHQKRKSDTIKTHQDRPFVGK